MRRISVFLAAIVALTVGLNLLTVGCSSAAPAPAPTKAAAPEPTKAPAAPAAQPTAAPAQPSAAQPTAAPAAKKVDFPQKGKTITLVVPYAAGGPSDVMARLIAPQLQEILGTNVEVINKVGAGSQVALTDVSASKPDGYTIGQMNLPTGITVYLDPERKAVFGRKDLAPLAVVSRAPNTILVKTDSPIKSLKELVDAAKANPGKVSMGAQGYMATTHMALLGFAKAAGVKFSIVQFDGAAPDITALIGGHIDAAVGNVDPPFIGAVKNGQARSLGIMDSKENKFMPGAPTFESQGFKSNSYNSFSWVLPANTPKEVVEILGNAFQKASQNPDFIKKMEDAGMVVDFMGPQQMGTFWDDLEVQIKPMMEQAKAEQK